MLLPRNYRIVNPVQCSFSYVRQLLFTSKVSYSLKVKWNTKIYFPRRRSCLETAWTKFKPTLKQGLFIKLDQFLCCLLVQFWIIFKWSCVNYDGRSAPLLFIYLSIYLFFWKFLDTFDLPLSPNDGRWILSLKFT